LLLTVNKCKHALTSEVMWQLMVLSSTGTCIATVTFTVSYDYDMTLGRAQRFRWSPTQSDICRLEL